MIITGIRVNGNIDNILIYLAGDAEDEGICETGDKLPTDVIQDILSLCR
jgi:hypothetical protein